MPTHDDTLLHFRIDCIPCAVVAGSVQSIVMPPEQLTQPPGSNRGRPGIFRHAGHVFAVVDLRQRFGIETPRQGAGRLLLHENGSRRHALWVDEVVGLVRTEEGQWATLPPYLPRSLFYSGFLYQQQIILCSTLEALLAMHDAEPIRRHLEQLRQREPHEAAAISATAARHPEQPPTAPEAADTPAPAAPREHPPETAHTTKHKAQAVSQSRPTPPTRPPAAARPATQQRPHTRTTTVTRPPQRTPPATPPPADRSVAPMPRQAVPAPALPDVHPVTPRHNKQRRGLWLVVILLLTGGAAIGLYRLLTPLEKAVPGPRRSVPPASVPSKAAPIIPPAPAPAAIPATPPLPAPPVRAIPVPTALEGKGTGPVQIERDTEGTITMIIQRERLQASSSANLPAADNGAPRPAAAVSAGETAEDATAQDDAEWAEPAALPEPCDCTHIVVKGDTLWAIAQQYTHSAFNYPELARQSGISNPHRIYPGNKVRIIVR